MADVVISYTIKDQYVADVAKYFENARRPRPGDHANQLQRIKNRIREEVIAIIRLGKKIDQRVEITLPSDIFE